MSKGHLRIVKPKAAKARKRHHHLDMLAEPEQRRVRAAISSLAKAYGGIGVLASVMGVSLHQLREVRNARWNVSIGMAVRVARAGGSTLEKLISPMGSVSICPTCGAERRAA